MSTYITQIGKHKFVCGLFWQSLSRPRDLWREAAELAKKIDADMMVLRKDQATAQAGYAHSRDGARRGMLSLAAMISKTLAIEGAYYDGQQQPVHNWLGAFKLPDGMWTYCAVRDANFLPNGDFAGTKAEVLERLHNDYGLGGWNIVIGDAELEEQGFHNFSPKAIEDLIPRKKDGQIRVHNWWRLRPVEQNLSWKPIAITGVVVIAVSVSGFTYWKHQQRKKQAEELAYANAAASSASASVAPPSPIPVIPHPWPSKPLPRDMAQACVEKLIFISEGGWTLDEYACNSSQVTYTWTRNGSTIDYLLAQVPKAIIDMSGDKATYSESLNLKTGQNEKLLETNKLLLSLHRKIQAIGLSLKVTNAGFESSPTGNSPQEAIPDWRTISFTIDTGGLPPIEIATLLNQPGIRLDKLSYRTGEWSMEGVIYAK